MTTEQSDGACTSCAKGMEMSKCKCREAYEKQYGEDFNPDHSPVASVWQAAWNAATKNAVKICKTKCMGATWWKCAEAIEREQCE